MLTYPISLTKDGDSLLVTAKDFPELTSFGSDREDALTHALDAVEEAIAARIASRAAVPAPSAGGRYRVTLPTQTAMKVLLYWHAREQGVTKAELARRLRVHPPQVDRLFDLRHASRLDQLDSAFDALGANLQIGLVATRGHTRRRGRAAARRS